jgi:hypothetical protein
MLKILNVRKKPIIIQAVLITLDNLEELTLAFKEVVIEGLYPRQTVCVNTLEGLNKAFPGAYLMIGVEGELYICQGEIFDKTYDVIEV